MVKSRQEPEAGYKAKEDAPLAAVFRSFLELLWVFHRSSIGYPPVTHRLSGAFAMALSDADVQKQVRPGVGAAAGPGECPRPRPPTCSAAPPLRRPPLDSPGCACLSRVLPAGWTGVEKDWKRPFP